MGRITAIMVYQPATKQEIRERITRYQKDLLSCKQDLVDIKRGKYKNGNSPSTPNAVHALRDECRKRIRHYVPALKELYWVIGEPIPDDIIELMGKAKEL